MPIDVQAMGIDCAGCGAYKWLMGDFGFGFLYVKEALQGRRAASRYGVRQYSAAAQSDCAVRASAGRGDVRGGQLRLRRRALHARRPSIHPFPRDPEHPRAREAAHRSTAEGNARLGFPGITPVDNPTPIVGFLTPKPGDAREDGQGVRRDRDRVRTWEFTDADNKATIQRGIRISPSVYNNQEDIDKLLKALA